MSAAAYRQRDKLLELTCSSMCQPQSIFTTPTCRPDNVSNLPPKLDFLTQRIVPNKAASKFVVARGSR